MDRLLIVWDLQRSCANMHSTLTIIVRPTRIASHLISLLIAKVEWSNLVVTGIRYMLHQRV